jgi:hypothetical protein
VASHTHKLTSNRFSNNNICNNNILLLPMVVIFLLVRIRNCKVLTNKCQTNLLMVRC